MLAKPKARHAQTILILCEDPTVEKHRNSVSTHQKRSISWFFIILIHFKIQQFALFFCCCSWFAVLFFFWGGWFSFVWFYFGLGLVCVQFDLGFFLFWFGLVFYKQNQQESHKPECTVISLMSDQSSGLSLCEELVLKRQISFLSACMYYAPCLYISCSSILQLFSHMCTTLTS